MILLRRILEKRRWEEDSGSLLVLQDSINKTIQALIDTEIGSGSHEPLASRPTRRVPL